MQISRSVFAEAESRVVMQEDRRTAQSTMMDISVEKDVALSNGTETLHVEHVLTPDTPTGGFTFSGMAALEDRAHTMRRATEDGVRGGSMNVRCWTEILNAIDKVKANACSWQSQADRLEATIAMLDTAVDDTLRANKSIQENSEDLSAQLSALHLDLKAQQGECRLLRETVHSLKRALVSEEHARRQLEHIQESKEMEWNSIKAHMRMEMELSKGVLAMHKEEESRLEDTHAREVHSLRYMIAEKDVEIENASKSIKDLNVTVESLTQELQISRVEAEKLGHECNDAHKKGSALAEEIKRNLEKFGEDKKRMEEVFQSHKDAHQACLHMKDIEISSLKDLHHSLQREYESKVSHLVSQKDTMQASLSHWKEKYEALHKRNEEQCTTLAEVQSLNVTLNADLKSALDTVQALQESEGQHAFAKKDLERVLKEQKEKWDAMEKELRHALDQEIANSNGLKASKSLTESNLAEIRETYNALLKEHQDLTGKYDSLKEGSIPKGGTSIHAVRPAAKRALQKRMKVTQRKTAEIHEES